MHLTVSLLAAALALTGPETAGPRPLPGEVRLQDCRVSLVNEAKVSAQEAGLLVALEATEGMHVEKDAFLARVNDSKARMAKRVAEAEHKVSEKQAANDVNVRFAVASEEVARAEYNMNREANVKHPGSKPLTELQRLLLVQRRAELQIEQADLEQGVAVLTAEAKLAQVEAAEDDIQRRQIVAPLSGVIQEVYPHVGEWLNPGDPVLRIVQLDRLRVEGAISAAEFAQNEILGRPVEVRVTLARGRFETFEGKIVYVDPLIELDGHYRVWAEVVNEQENGQWLLYPGASADMTIFTSVSAAQATALR